MSILELTKSSINLTTTGSISQLANWGQLAMLNWAFTTLPESGNNARPTVWYMGLSTTTPTTSGGGITEPAGSGYSRQSITFNPSSGNPGQISNDSQINFTANGGDWGTIVYGLVYDGQTLGHCWAVGPLDAARVIQNGDTLQFSQGSLTIGLI